MFAFYCQKAQKEMFFQRHSACFVSSEMSLTDISAINRTKFAGSFESVQLHQMKTKRGNPLLPCLLFVEDELKSLQCNKYFYHFIFIISFYQFQ